MLSGFLDPAHASAIKAQLSKTEIFPNLAEMVSVFVEIPRFLPLYLRHKAAA
jgi:hypothetical protein